MAIRANDSRIQGIIANLSNLNASDRFVNDKLCIGFITSRSIREAQEVKETQYAVLEDGRIFQTVEMNAPNPNFGKYRNNHACNWSQIDKLPDHAEFIGQYPVKLVKGA